MHVDGGREWVGARRRAVEGWPGCMGEGGSGGGGEGNWGEFVTSGREKTGSTYPITYGAKCIFLRRPYLLFFAKCS